MPKKVKRVVVCGGKVYYDLLEEAQKREARRRRASCASSSCIRSRAPNWPPSSKRFARRDRRRLVPGRAAEPGRVVPDPATTCAPACSRSRSLHYAGRARSPSPAAGHFADHVVEQAALVADALVNPLRRRRTRRITPAPDSTVHTNTRHPGRQPMSHRSQSSRPARIRFRRHHRHLAQEGRRRGQARREPGRPGDRQGRAGSALAGRRRAQGNQVQPKAPPSPASR